MGTELYSLLACSVSNFLYLVYHPQVCRNCISQTPSTQNSLISSNSGLFQTPDPVALRRITELEEELLKMREQIAKIVMNQEFMPQPSISCISNSVT